MLSPGLGRTVELMRLKQKTKYVISTLLVSYTFISSRQCHLLSVNFLLLKHTAYGCVQQAQSVAGK
jgi:hypothetical protein